MGLIGFTDTMSCNKILKKYISCIYQPEILLHLNGQR